MQLKDTQLLVPLLQRCIQGHRRSQNKLYDLAFPYAMSVAMRYGANREDSLEIVNASFFKMFSYLKSFDPSLSFTTWLRRIVINTAIDHFNLHQKALEDTEFIDDDLAISLEMEAVLDKLHAADLLRHIQSLPPSYRLVFSLFAIEGYSHKEIGAQLGITEGASKSNYHKARLKLQNMLLQQAGPLKKIS